MLEIEAALQTLGAVKTLVAGAFNAKVDHEVRAKQIEIQSAMLQLQEHLLNATQERLELIKKVDEMQRTLRDTDDLKRKLSGYELVRMEDGAAFYKSKGNADHPISHFACPPCYEAGNVRVLQETKTGDRQQYYLCATCKFSRSIGPDDPMESISYERF